MARSRPSVLEEDRPTTRVHLRVKPAHGVRMAKLAALWDCSLARVAEVAIARLDANRPPNDSDDEV